MTNLNDPQNVQKSSSCLLALTKLFANKHHGEHNHHEAKIKYSSHEKFVPNPYFFKLEHHVWLEMYFVTI